MALPREYISYSQIRLYQACPKKYYYTYVENISTPVNDKIFLGIVFHAVVEHYFKEKIEREEPSKHKLMAVFSEIFEKKQKQLEILWDHSEKETARRGKAFLEYFLREVSPDIKPMMVEKELIARVPGVDVPLKGVIDLIETDFSITDFKTTTAKWSKKRIKSAYLQVVIYRFLFEKNFGDVIKQLKFRILYSKSASMIRHQEVAIKARDLDPEYKQMFDIVKYVVENIQNGVFYKNENFSCGFCEHRGLCRAQSEPL